MRETGRVFAMKKMSKFEMVRILYPQLYMLKIVISSKISIVVLPSLL